MTPGLPIVEAFRARPAADGEGIEVEAESGPGAVRGLLHRAALGPLLGCLLEAERLSPARDDLPATLIRVDAVGLTRTEAGEVTLAIQVGGAVLAFALDPAALAGLHGALGEIIGNNPSPTASISARARSQGRH